jgi:hypothetical protein
MKLIVLYYVGLRKLHLFLFGFLRKGIVFCRQPSITSSHIILFSSLAIFLACDLTNTSNTAILATCTDSVALFARCSSDSASACEIE